MNIITIDSDGHSIDTLKKYCQDLSLNFQGFYHGEDFFTWSENKTINVDFLFIAIHNESGFELSLQVKKAISSTKPLSIIFLLSNHNDSHCIQSLKYGDGYLIKPFSCDLLLSSIHYYSKLHNLNYLLSQRNKKLTEHQKTMKREHDIVEAIFSKHCSQHLISSNSLRSYISPASVFNGDILLTAEGPSGSLYLAVGDVTGHGLPAAVGALPVYSTFREMASNGKNIGSIAAAMNDDLRSLLPDNMMMATILMELNFIKGQAFIWAGGMPEVIIVNHNGSSIKKVMSRHSPLSVLTPERFRKDVDTINLNDGDRLYFYTDGIEESRNKDDDIFGTERFQSLFDQKPNEIFNDIINQHKNFIHNSIQDDDITLAEITYRNSDHAAKLFINTEKPTTLSIPWSIEFPLSEIELKSTDPVAQIINFLKNSIDIDVHQDCISTIISELYNNAVDHGLLELDSTLKNKDDGLIDYYIARKNKLSTLSSGHVLLKMNYSIEEESNDGLLTISITDSGDGFDHQKQYTHLTKNKQYYGRGIELVKELCLKLDFKNDGRTAIAYYTVDRSQYKAIK